jgi:metal-sulfur cluster biosynthetic enzyme
MADHVVDIAMTMTTPRCPLHLAITQDVQTVIGMLPDSSDARMRLVWSPPWDLGMMSEAARTALCSCARAPATLRRWPPATTESLAALLCREEIPHGTR